MSQGPADPLTPLMVGAAATHELYVSYLAAGFTAEQAYGLTVAVLVETIRANSGRPHG